MMGRFWNLLVLLGTIGVLLAFMIGLQEFEFQDVTHFNPKALAATGFIVLAAFAMGEMFKQFNLPSLLGYIAAGVLFGPNLAPLLPGQPEALFSDAVIGELTLVNVLTVGLIGTMGGGELIIADIKKNFKTIALISVCFALVAIPASTVAVLILSDYAPSIVPFMEGLPQADKYAAALMLGVFSMAMSPAATLAIIQDTRAKGPFTSLTLGTVIVADILLVEAFLIVFALDVLIISPEGFTSSGLVAALPAIGAEIGYAILIGLVTGAVFIGYLRFIGKETLLFTVAVIFAGSYAAKVLHAETLMAFLTAGFVVQNFSKHGHAMIESLERISLPVFIVYFMTQAAVLDLEAVAGYVWLTLILAGLRGFAIYVGTQFATRASNASEKAKRFLWLGFFSRGGVDLVLASMVAGGLGEWGKDLQTVIMASVIVHIVIGPPMLQKALDWAGETEASRNKNKQEAEALDKAITVKEEISAEQVFPLPAFDDSDLNEWVGNLRKKLIQLYENSLTNPIDKKTDRISKSLETLQESQREAIRELTELLASDKERTALALKRSVDEAHAHYLNSIQNVIDTWERLDPIALEGDVAQQLMGKIQGLVPYTSVIRIVRGNRLLESMVGDAAFRRFLKLGRRIRSMLAGPGVRTVPMGRLWRYYVELSVPRFLNRAAKASGDDNEAFWQEVSFHVRRVDEVFEKVALAVANKKIYHPTPREDDEEDDGHGHEHGHENENEELADEVQEELGSRACALATLEHFVTTCDAERSGLRDAFETWRATSRDAYSASLRKPYADFLNAVGFAGTLELPNWKFRPSTRFDLARSAEIQLRDRILREREVVTGHRGWIVVEHQLLVLGDWFDTYQTHVTENLDVRVLALCHTNLKMLQNAIDAQIAAVRENDRAVIRWGSWLESDLRPSIRRSRKVLEQIQASYGQGIAARQLLDALDNRIGLLSESVVLFNAHPENIGLGGHIKTFDVPVRGWFESEFSREMALRFVELNERAQGLMRIGLDGIAEVQQVLEFNLLTAEQESGANEDSHAANHLALGGLERAQRLLRELVVANDTGVREIKRWFHVESEEILQVSMRPFFAHKLDVIQRVMNRKVTAALTTKTGSWPVRQVNYAVDMVTGTYDRLAPVANEVAGEVRSFLIDEDPLADAGDIRDRLLLYERDGSINVPPIYRRLFTPVPLDIPDFYVPRPQFESEVASAIGEWTVGHRTSIAIHGPRGSGKRSSIHHILHGPVQSLLEFGEVDTFTITFSEDLGSEANLITEIGTAIGAGSLESLDEIHRYLAARQRKSVIVIENGEKIFQRTEDGLKTANDFLHLMSDSGEHALWIVLIGSPAADWLQIAMGFFDYFTHQIEMPPLTMDQIQEMILNRHRVSGFSTRFDRPQIRVEKWLRNPFSLSEAVRDPQHEFFIDLTRLSGGNPLLSLLYWLESVKSDASDDQLMRVGTLPDREIELLGQLSLQKRVILATLVQHHSLTVAQISQILRRDPELIRTEIEHLNRLGFLETKLGRDMNCFQLKPLAEALVLQELRCANMI